MGFSLKSVGNLIGRAGGAALGAFFGGPAGAVAGYSGSDAILGAVGLGSDQIAAENELGYRKKLADYQYSKNLQMWNLQNAYNDPAAQMERLKAAGLNPNLVYGGGNVTGNAGSSAPSYEYPSVSYNDNSVQRKQLQLALEEHQQRITNQAIENDLARQRLVLSEREADRSDALAQAQIKAYEANLGVSDANVNNMLYSQDQRSREYALKQYKEDLRDWQHRFDINYNKFAAHVNQSKELRRVYAIVGRRPMLMDYLKK